MTVKKLTYMAVLTAVALIIFVIEAQIHIPFLPPGAKLGLANIVTVFALFSNGNGKMPVKLKTSDVLMILLCRIVLGALFTGRVLAFIYSLAGGALCFCAMALVRRVLTERQIWVCSIVGSIFHNIGQIAAAVLVTGSVFIAAYLPVLTITGIITGLLTGFAAQFLSARLRGAAGR